MGFCQAWAWDALQTFLTVQGYSWEAADQSSIFQDLQHAVQRHAWPSNPKARLALLYLIGKAKSSIRVEILWRPITAASSPIISRSHLRIAARAYTCFLRTLVSELPTAFLVRNLNDMGSWVRKLGSWSPQCIGEAGCKEQFDHVPPSVNHMREAAA